ncbi:MAG: addiction module protein [Betaproteobacteria bacterium]|nr:addiction module protein [Betaproteobacteria bacterium]
MLAIDLMSRSEKLELAQALWRDLGEGSATVESVSWHGAALDEAQQALCYREIPLRRRRAGDAPVKPS